MQARRLTYTIDGETFTFRPIHARDIQAITGKLGILPTDRGDGRRDGLAAWQSNDLMDQVLSRCSKSPKLVLEEFDGEPPEGVFSVHDLAQKIWLELATRLAKDSGIGVEAADEVRPSSGTEPA